MNKVHPNALKDEAAKAFTAALGAVDNARIKVESYVARLEEDNSLLADRINASGQVVSEQPAPESSPATPTTPPSLSTPAPDTNVKPLNDSQTKDNK